MLPAAEHVRALLLDLLLGEEGLRLGHDSVGEEGRRGGGSVRSRRRGRRSWGAQVGRQDLDFGPRVGAGMWMEDLGRGGGRSGRDEVLWCVNGANRSFLLTQNSTAGAIKILVSLKIVLNQFKTRNWNASSFMSGAPETAPLLPANPNVTPKGAFTVQASHIPSDSTSIPFLLSCEVRPHEVSATSSHRRSTTPKKTYRVLTKHVPWKA